MQGTRIALAGLALGLAWLGALGSQTTARAEERARLNYDIYVGGLPVMALTAELNLSDDRYAMSLALDVTGLAKFILPWSLRSDAEGHIEDARPRPIRASSLNRWRDKPRTVSLAWDEDGTVKLTASPEVKPDDRRFVPPVMRRGAVDLVSAIVTASKAIDSGENCTRSIRVFSGRRLFDLVLAHERQAMVAGSSYSVYQGAAEICRVMFRDVPGPWNKPAESGDGVEVGAARVWIAPPGPRLPPLPVRFEMESDYGPMIAHLAATERLQPADPAP